MWLCQPYQVVALILCQEAAIPGMHMGFSSVPPQSYRASLRLHSDLHMQVRHWALTRRSEGSSSGALYVVMEIRLGPCICNIAIVRISTPLQANIYWR